MRIGEWKAYLGGLGLGLCLITSAQAQDYLTEPDPNLTPGKVCVTDLFKICSTRWGRDRRFVTENMKNEVFEKYKIKLGDRKLENGKPRFEMDHLISRELGGCDDVTNLWAQVYVGTWNAHMKDELENKLHKEVCEKGLDLSLAQSMILKWKVTYCKYFPNEDVCK